MPAPTSPPPSRARLYGLLGLMLVIWSANYIFAKVAVRGAPPLLAALLRTLLSGMLMWPLYRWAPWPADPGVRPWAARDVPRLVAVGVLGIVCNQILFVVALSRTSVAHGALVGTLSPVLVLVGAAALGQERLTRAKVLGMGTAAAGVAVLQLGRSPTGAPTLVGDLVMLASGCLFAGFSVLGKRVASTFGAMTVNFFAFVGGGILVLPAVIWAVATGAMARVSPLAWCGIAYMAIFPSLVGYTIYAYALRWLPASRVASQSYLQPVLATLMAVAILGERPGPSFLTGAVLVLGGVYVAQRRRTPILR